MRRPRLLTWSIVLAVTIAALAPFRDRLDTSHITLALLLVVLAAAADGGRRLGLLAAVAAFLSFNWFFLPPFGTLVIADPLDWFVLFAFLGTSFVASHLFHRVQREAEQARARTVEVTTLATLGAEAMSAPRADGALRVVAEATRQALGVATCRIHVVRDGESTTTALDSLVTVTSPAAEGAPLVLAPVRLALDRGTRVAVLSGDVVRIVPQEGPALRVALVRESARRLLLPLRAGTMVIGVLDVEDAGGLVLDEARERLLTALVHYAALGAERTRLERAAERLELMREADQMRTAVLASVSHDLRTPLTTIKALAHDMGSLADERSEMIEQEADRLNRFVADLLDVSRLASGRFPLRVAIVPVEELISAALQQAEGSFAGRRINVSLPTDDPFPLARFDLTHSVRILVNLLENARKYAPGDTPVDIAVERTGAAMLVRVSDRGPGVAPDEEATLFDALHRPPSSRPEVGSAGLGLAIAHGLAEAQGGSLGYTPRAGGGSVFTLSLPAADVADIEAELRPHE